MQERISPLIDRQITFAHRGARAHLPENTIEAFELAIRLGATGLESDTWISRDGIAVLDHDGVVRGRIRNKPISSFNRSELPGWIPSLADLYRRCGAELHLSLDIKDINSMGAVVETIAESGNPKKTWLCHPDLTFLEQWVGHVAGANLVHSTRLKAMLKGPERHAAILRDLGVRSVRLLTNNPAKRKYLEDAGVTVTETVPLLVGLAAENEGYLEAKRERMGHHIDMHDGKGEGK